MQHFLEEQFSLVTAHHLLELYCMTQSLLRLTTLRIFGHPNNLLVRVIRRCQVVASDLLGPAGLFDD